MVSVVEIITENEIADLMVGNMRTQQTWNGITATFQGNAWTVDSITDAARQAHPNVRANQPLPRPLRGNFINLARASVSLPLVNFDARGNVVGDIVNSRTGAPRPQGDGDLRANPDDRIGARPQQGQAPRVPLNTITDIYDSRLIGSEELTPEQRRQLNQNGRFVAGGLTYTQDDIGEIDRRMTRHINTLQNDNRLKNMQPQNPEGQARSNLRILRSSATMARKVIARTVIPVAFSPTANISAIFALRDMIADLNYKMIPGSKNYDATYTPQQYNTDVTRVMGAWYVSTMLPIFIGALRGTVRLTAAGTRAMFGLVKAGIDRSNGEPRLGRRRSLKGWVSWQVRRFIDFLKTEATAAIVVNLAGRYQPLRELFLDFLSQEYVAQIAEGGFVAGEAVETIIRRNWPDFAGGTANYDSINNFLQNELGMDMDRGAQVDGAGGDVNPVDPNDTNLADEI